MPGTLAVSAFIGFAAGILSGLFGIGGGIITTPALRLLLHTPALVAVGTPLPVIIPTAVAGAIAYWRRGLVDVRLGVVVGVLGGFFSILGAWLSGVVGGSVVLIITAALILWTAIDMIEGVRHPRSDSEMREGAARGRSLPWVVGLAGAAGLYSGFLGLGGGLIVTPVLIRFFGVDTKRAIGTSLVAVACLAVPGTIAHHLLGHIDVGVALSMCVGVVPGALVGARLTLRAHERSVRIGFAIMLLVAGVVLALGEIGVM